MWAPTFTGSHLRAVTDATDDDDADNAGRHSTTTRATYRQSEMEKQRCIL